MRKIIVVLIFSVSFTVLAPGLDARNEIPGSRTGIIVEEQNPCPKADVTHRYIKVPLVYSRPELGTFQLYYETNGDFDPAKRTLFILNDGQQQKPAVGAPDELKKEYQLDMNIVRMEHRGMPCSKVDYVFSKKGVDWPKAYDVFRSENVIEDIDRIRMDLLGENGTVFLMGGSGAGTLACQYLAKYSIHVDRAFIYCTSDDPESANLRQHEKFLRLLENDGMAQAYQDILKKRTVPPVEFLWIVQRLGYDYRPEEKMQIKFIQSLQAGDRSLYEKYAKDYQDVEKFAEMINKTTPFSTVRIYEMGIVCSNSSPTDPTCGLEPLIRPLKELEKAGAIHPKVINVRKSLSTIKTEVLLVAARWDNILPYEEMVDMNKNMPHSRLAIMDDLHSGKKIKACFPTLFRALFENGVFSQEVDRVLASGDCPVWK